MKKPSRPLSLCYEIARKSLRSRIDNHYGGICIILLTCGLTSDEEFDITNHFNANKPCGSQHQEFYRTAHWTGMRYWWCNKREGHEVRIKFLDKLIQQCKDDEAASKGTKSV